LDLTKDIIFISTADWDCPFWTNKQHMAVALAERGYRILYVESMGLRKPTLGKKDITRVFGRLRKWAGGLREVRKNIWVFSPIVIPYHELPWVKGINIRVLCRYIRKYMRHLKFRNPILWTYNPLSIDMVGSFNESIVVYHCVDDLTAAPGMPVNSILTLEKNLVQRADIIFTTSPRLHETRSRWNPNNTYYFPNVADFNHFSTACQQGRIPEDIQNIPHPRIGFIGAISEYKVDFELISFVAEKRKDWHWVMIGQVGEGQPETSVNLLKRANIHLLGPKQYQILPDYLRGFDVAVLPCPKNDYTTSMFPMKFFEYLSAGKPVVATDLPALRHYADACILTQTPDDFIQAIDSVFKGKMPDKKKCLELAQEHTWQKRLDQMEKLLMEKFKQKNS
jgi:glycosyltransferase involved in cell wall biosynthesis